MENTNEEVKEEITDINESTKENDVIVETANEEAIIQDSTDNPVATDSSNVEMIDDSTNENSSEDKELIDSVYKKKSKAPLLIILSILLVLDIAALVIYLIGIDKVLSFIK